MIDFSFTEEQILLRKTVHSIMESIATSEYCSRLDREQSYPIELYREWVAAGLLQMPFPIKYGGLDGNVIDVAIIAEELSRRSFDFFTAYSNCVFCGQNLVRNGNETQKRFWLPKIMSGETKMSVSMSEPDAGSDVGAMRTTARREGRNWVINGQKLWATGAGAPGNVINVYAKTDTKAHYREGISLFLVDNESPGVTLRKLDMLGRRAVGTYEIFFDNVEVPDDRLVGQENRGWECMLSGLRFERMIISAGYCGNMQAIVDMALSYAKERKQFKRAIGTFQAIGHMLADMQTTAEAARMLTLHAAWKLASDVDSLREISMAKLFASEAHVRIANQGMQILGAYGYTMEYDMQRYFRDARASTIGGGSSQMQRDLIANLMGLKTKG